MANSRGSEAKSRSRRCFTLVSVTTPAEARTPLPTKFAVAEKHIGVDFSLAHFTPVVAEHKTQNTSCFNTVFIVLHPLCHPEARGLCGPKDLCTLRQSHRRLARSSKLPVLKPCPVSGNTHLRADGFPFQLSFL